MHVSAGLYGMAGDPRCRPRNCADNVRGMTASGTAQTDVAADSGTGTSATDAAMAPEGAWGASAPEPPPQDPTRMTAWVRGRVQGVGFRWFTRENALRIGGLEGFAVNLDDGRRVQIVAEGSRHRCESLLRWLRTGDTPGRVDGVTEIWGAPRGGYSGFAIR